MALTASETNYLASLYAAREKLLSGKWVKGSGVGGQERDFADPPPLAYLNKEIDRLEGKAAEAAGNRRISTTVKSDTW